MNTHNPETESDAIRSDIEQTRESMDRTLDEIGQRMQPRHLLDAALDLVRSYSPEGKAIGEKAGTAAKSAGQAASRAVTKVVNVVREHPVPTLLIGVGIALAIIEGRRSRAKSSHSNGNGNGNGHGDHPHELGLEFESAESGGGMMEKASEKFSAAGEKIQSGVKAAGDQFKVKSQRLGERISEKARTVGKKAGELVSHRYEVGRAKFGAAREAHPLSLGVGFLAAGMLVGLAMPPTRREDRLMGDMSDQAKDTAKAKAQDLLERGKHVATAAAQAAKETAAQEGLAAPENSGLTP